VPEVRSLLLAVAESQERRRLLLGWSLWSPATGPRRLARGVEPSSLGHFSCFVQPSAQKGAACRKTGSSRGRECRIAVSMASRPVGCHAIMMEHQGLPGYG
jgi:hypothetical protein